VPKVTFIGAGSAVFARQLMTDILAIDGLDEGTFALVDIDAERLGLAKGIAERLVEDCLASAGALRPRPSAGRPCGHRLRHQLDRSLDWPTSARLRDPFATASTSASATPSAQAASSRR
jgi:hypothetical protein